MTKDKIRDIVEDLWSLSLKTPSGGAIIDEGLRVTRLLLNKNLAYGNSALQPIRVFSKAGTLEQIDVRIDDKLSRVSRGKEMGEDVIQDLVGYLILRMVAHKANDQ